MDSPPLTRPDTPALGETTDGAAPARVAPGLALRRMGAAARGASRAQVIAAVAVLAVTASVGALAQQPDLPGPHSPAGRATSTDPGAQAPTDPAQAAAHPVSPPDTQAPPPVSAPAPTAVSTPRRHDSGRIGRWQEMGHEASGIALERRVSLSPKGVVLLGDSSLTRARPKLLEALAGRPVSWDQWNGRPSAATVDVAAAIDGAGRLPKTVVLLAGSNDVFFPEGFAYQVERLLTIAGPQRHIVWVAPYVARPRFAQADEHNTRALRADLLAAARRHPNLHVVDWAGHVLGLPEADRKALMPDGAHPSPRGCAELVRLVEAALG